jgi:hypothetical protein
LIVGLRSKIPAPHAADEVDLSSDKPNTLLALRIELSMDTEKSLYARYAMKQPRGFVTPARPFSSAQDKII